MQLYPRVHQIQSLFGGRNLFQYLFAGEIVVLLDTGVATTPAEVIFPYMEEIGVSPQKLTLAIITHADLDHQGGNSAIREASPSTLLACHRADRELIEQPRSLYRHRYNHLQSEHGTALPEDGIELAGDPTSMNLLLQGGEILHLGSEWDLNVWHVPGHSDGHLALYDARHRSAFVSDAIHGRGCPTASGEMAFGPTYYAVDAYLATIHFLEQQPIEHLYSGHWPNVHGPDVGRFLSESRRFVEITDQLLPGAIQKHPDGATLGEIINDLSPRLGNWSSESSPLLMWALYGHLVRREQRGNIRRAAGARPVRWQLADAA